MCLLGKGGEHTETGCLDRLWSLHPWKYSKKNPPQLDTALGDLL